MPIQDEPTIKEVLEENEFELPIGFTDADGVLHKTVKLREMTGEVDEAIGDAKVRTNVGKVTTEALYGVVESIGTMRKHSKDTVRSLTNVDRDLIMLMNHKVSIGETIEYVDSCPSCGAKSDISVDVDKIPVRYMTEDEPKTLELELPSGVKNAEGQVFKKIILEIPNGTVQERIFPMFSQNYNSAITQMLAMITKDIPGLSHYNFKTFQQMTKRDRKYINDQLAAIDVGVDMQVPVECSGCGKSYKSPIPYMTLLGE